MHREPEADAFVSTLARFLKRLSGVEVGAIDFDEASIEPHLRMNLQVQDESGKNVIASSRDLAELRVKFGARAQRAFAGRAARDLARAGLIRFPDVAIPAQLTGDGGIPAFPALHDDGETVSLHVHAQREVAERHHVHGVRRLLRLALADKLKQARRQLPVQARTALLYAAIESALPRQGGKTTESDRLREDLVDGAFAALSADGLAAIRDAEAFAVRRDAIGKALFAEAMQRLQQAETILSLIADIRARLESKLMGWASGNLDDMRAHLETLARPGFLREVPADALSEYPRWLKALSLRAERAQRDPVKDQARMLELKPFVDALAAAVPDDAQARALRWELEELRVATFAQELGVKGGVSAKKLAGRITGLR